MLKGIDPLLSGALLKALDELGHGQTVAVVDRDVPAHSTGLPVVRVDVDIVSARSVLSVLPLDASIHVVRMQVADHPSVVFPQGVSRFPLLQHVSLRACMPAALRNRHEGRRGEQSAEATVVEEHAKDRF